MNSTYCFLNISIPLMDELPFLNHNSTRNVTILPMIFISETIRQCDVLFGWIGHLCTGGRTLRENNQNAQILR